LFVQHGLTLLQAMDRIGVELSDLRQGVTRHVRLAASTAAISQFLPPLLAGYAKAHPEVRVELSEQVSREVLAMLRERRADVGIFVEGADAAGLQTQLFREDELVVVLPPNHARARPRTELAFAELLDEDWIGLNDGAAVLQTQQQAALAAGRPLRLRMQVRSFDAACHMVASGLGLTVLPRAATLPVVRAMKLVTCRLTDPWARRRLLLATAPDSADAGVLQLLAFLTAPSQNAKAARRRRHRCAGLKVLELGQLIAGPFAAKTLADFGADVIKVEPPGTGDPLRKWRLLKDGTSVWWQVQSRNKRSVALDLRTPRRRPSCAAGARGRRADRELPPRRDGSLGPGPRGAAGANPRLIVLRVSGYGQTGPYRDKPGFGVVAEAMGGLRHLSGEPGRVPVRVGVSIGDTLAALHGVIGILMALHERHTQRPGQVIDVALYEAVFNCMESLLPEYSAFGAVRGPAGSALPGIAPSNAYRCADGGYALVAGNGDSIFKRLMACHRPRRPGRRPGAGRQRRPRGARGRDRRRHRRLDRHAHGRRGAGRAGRRGVPAGRIYTVADIAADPHYQARGMLSRCRWTTAARSRCRASCPSCRARPAATGATRRRSGRTPTQVLARDRPDASADPGPQRQRHRAEHAPLIMSIPMSRIHFNEVVTRDGFQIEPFVPTDDQGRADRRSVPAASPRSRSPRSPRPRPSRCCATPRR
jgi:formyl-CoA transferase